MRRPPEWTQFTRFPMTAGTILLSAGVSIAWWAKVDITPVLDTIDIRRGEVWRLITDVLPHVNFIHLLFNVLWLWTFGTLIEEKLGHAFTLGGVHLPRDRFVRSRIRVSRRRRRLVRRRLRPVRNDVDSVAAQIRDFTERWTIRRFRSSSSGSSSASSPR